MHAIAIVVVVVLVSWLPAGLAGSRIGHYVENTSPHWEDDMRHEVRGGFVTLFVSLFFLYLKRLDRKEKGNVVAASQRIAA